MIVDTIDDGASYGGFPISTKNFGHSAGPYYYISKHDEDFAATGLDGDSYLYYETVFEIGADEIRRRIGSFTNALLRAVSDASGIDCP